MQVFAMPETSLGLFPDVGASYFLSRLPGFYGEYVALVGARLDGAEMLACGLATHFVPSNVGWKSSINAFLKEQLKKLYPLFLQWMPPRLEQVHDDAVEEYFSRVDDPEWEDLDLPVMCSNGRIMESKL
ncbi:3-hydroxyisobutyryl-CoA hydrolase 1 [Zea mays]|uniref:3-hydroxyisobutyryl-CoA hydrolase n=1 Tax=Zea mays TaxID=4577 RepID=A0A1D6F8I8_MAIZE|nr:3-hydroxyisobutyryl-CoA hydrolase 1 [Zea mays]